MSNQAASTRGGPSSRRSPPRKPEDRDAIVTHQTRPGGLGLPPLVLASVTRGRGRGRGFVDGRGMGYRGGGIGSGMGAGRGGPPPSRGLPMPKITGSNTLPVPSGQSPESRWVRPPATAPPARAPASTAPAASDSSYLARYGSRPIDTYIPARSSSPDHRRWDSPPSNPQTGPRQVPAGPSNYAARPPPPPRIPSSGPMAQVTIPTGPRSTLPISEPTPSTSTPTANPPSQIVPMKFRPIPNVPKEKIAIPAPIHSSADGKEENGDDEEAAMNGPVVPSRNKSPAPAMDEKEDIEMEEDIKPDITIIQGQTTAGRQDRNTIDDNRNDGVLAWS